MAHRAPTLFVSSAHGCRCASTRAVQQNPARPGRARAARYLVHMFFHARKGACIISPSRSPWSSLPSFTIMSEKHVGLSQIFPPKPTWTAADVPNQAGRVAIITGGSGGIYMERKQREYGPIFMHIYWPLLCQCTESHRLFFSLVGPFPLSTSVSLSHPVVTCR